MTEQQKGRTSNRDDSVDTWAVNSAQRRLFGLEEPR